MHPSNKGFSQWCARHGFDMDASVRSNAIWWASMSATITDIPGDASHPTAIRKWHRDQAPAPSPEMSLETPEPTVNLQAVAAQARKINALANSAAAGDETAKRHLAKKAKDFGCSVEEVVKTARAVAPELTVPPTRSRRWRRRSGRALELAINMITLGKPYAFAPERGIRREVPRPHYATIG